MNDSNLLELHASTQRANFERGSIFFVGTATVLIQYGGFTILTDPNFLHKGDHIDIGYGMQAVRMTNPAINMEQLPTLDLVLLSHLHEDHFDRMVEKQLDKGTPIVTTPQAAQALRRKCFSATQPLTTWETLTVTKGENSLRITALPALHGPGALNYALPQVMGSMLEFVTPVGNTAFRLYISGDTLLHEQLKEIPRCYPDIDMAIVHLGGVRLFGILLTMDAQQGLEAIHILNPHEIIPVHYNDYNVFKSSLDDFKAFISLSEFGNRVRYLEHGNTYTFEVGRKQ